MPGTIIEVWTCDRCGARHVRDYEAEVYSDPTIYPPSGWDTVHDESRPAGEDELGIFCSICLPIMREKAGEEA